MEINETKVYLMNVEPLKDEQVFLLGHSLINDYRKCKIDKITKTESKILSLGAGLLLRYAIINEGFNYKNIDVKLTKNDKPYIEPFYYNLSHSGDYVLLVISSDEVGCDIQKIIEVNQNLAPRFLTHREQELIKNGSKKSLCRLWSLKESIIKLNGESVERLADYDFSNCPDEPNFCKNYDGVNVRFKTIDILKEYEISIAYKTNTASDIQLVEVKDCLEK